MGTINYKTSEFITIGCDLNKGCRKRNGETNYSKINRLAEKAEEILDNYSFDNFKVNLEWGYYEGFQVDIESYFDSILDSYEERKELHKEITQVRKLLTELKHIGLVSCYPGWCTGYADSKRTTKDIREAIIEMRRQANTLITWKQYEKSGKSFEDLLNGR